MPGLLDPAARLEGVPQPLGALQEPLPVPAIPQSVGAGDSQQDRELDVEAASRALSMFVRRRLGALQRNR